MFFITFCDLNISLKLLKTDSGDKTRLGRNENALLEEESLSYLIVYGQLEILTFQSASLSSGLMTGTQSLLQPPFC